MRRKRKRRREEEGQQEGEKEEEEEEGRIFGLLYLIVYQGQYICKSEYNSILYCIKIINNIKTIGFMADEEEELSEGHSVMSDSS